MTPTLRLDAEQIHLRLRECPRWALSADGLSISRSFSFADFKAAFAFMTRVSELAEKQAHHPEWFNVYNRVDVRLTTHDVGGVSERDFVLARAIDASV